MSDIYLLGISGNRLNEDCKAILARCQAVVASRRHRQLVEKTQKQIIPITPIQQMIEAVTKKLPGGDIAILASGDPLFFGIGRKLLDQYNADRLHIVPAVSSVQLACALMKEPWDNMKFLSLHGRESGYLPGMLLRYPKVMILTDQYNSPNHIAGELLSHLEHQKNNTLIHSIRITVVENAGLEGEKVTRSTLAEIANKTFSTLNLMLIKQDTVTTQPRFGLTESELAHSRGLITKDEVRAATLFQLRLPETGVFWDVGAGSGSVSVSAARLNPGLHVCAIEKKPEELKNITDNVTAHQTSNVQVISGPAPEALADLPAPDRVFIGGSGGMLPEIIRYSVSSLAPGGRIVVNSVIKKTAAIAPKILHDLGLQVDMRRIAVTRWQYGESEKTSMNPITLITGRK